MRLLGKEDREDALEGALEACGLREVRRKRIETLSKGYKQRVGLAQAIIHDPPILILDEPTSGLDPNQIIEIRSLIKELGKRKTVILSTHILQEVEAICSQVLILNEGRIAAQGTPEEIAGSMKGGDTWELILKGSGPVEERLRSLEENLCPRKGLDSVRVREEAGETRGLSFFIRGGEEGDGERIFDWAVREGFKILGMTRKSLSLEDIFVRLTSEGRGPAHPPEPGEEMAPGMGDGGGEPSPETDQGGGTPEAARREVKI
jgi:ABC-2 type transport system ATP-binding protein